MTPARVPLRCARWLVLFAVLTGATSSGAWAASVTRVLHDPFRSDGGGATAEQLAALGRTADPHDALDSALSDLAAAPDAATAAAARERALAILEGRSVEGAFAFEGLPLLNWDVPAKVRDVPAGGSIVVRQVRFDGHVLSDTARLRFADPQLPWTLILEVVALGAGQDGHLATTLLDGAGTGRHLALQPLAIDVLATGTRASSRFVPDGAPEGSRLAVTRREVAMPAPGTTVALLEPNRPGRGPALATLAPATPEREAAVADAFGFTGQAPTAAERDAAIGRLADLAPEKQLWADLRAADPVVDPVTATPEQAAAALTAARAVGAGGAALVGVMRDRTRLPPGVPTHPTADVTVALLNGETYVSRTAVRPRAGRAVSVAVINADRFSRTVQATQLSGRRRAFGADDWGAFDWRRGGGGLTLAAGASGVLEVPVGDDAFTLIVGDDVRGDQGSAVIELQRGAVRDSARVGGNATLPLHLAFDAQSRGWATLAGVDRIVRLTPPADGPIAASSTLNVLLPDGVYEPGAAPEPRWGPADIEVGGDGIVWATLAVGNAIARIDPARTNDGTSDGVTIYELEACTEAICRPPPPPAPPGPLSREPLQLELFEDGTGATVLAFTEALGDRIGLLRVAADGRRMAESHVPCGCTSPLGIDLDPDGSIWFSEGVDNRIGHLTLDQARPWSEAAVTLVHHPIPSGGDVCDFDPELVVGRIVCSSVPHSVALDTAGRVWFTQTATGKIGRLEPTAARADTTNGFREFELPVTDFGRVPDPADLAIDRAGTVFWADEYGDVIGEMDKDGIPRPAFRPAERQSLTDSPAITPTGDVWFVESAAALLTRLRGVSAGAPPVGPAPHAVADVARGLLTVSGFRDVTSARWSVRRAGVPVVPAAEAAVTAGGFEVGVALAPGDDVKVTPVGPGAGAPLAFRVVELLATRRGDEVSGTARLGGVALADAVSVRADAGAVRAPIDPQSGAFSAAVVGPVATVAWARGTSAGRFVTVAPVRAATTPPPPAADPPPPAQSPPPTTPGAPVSEPSAGVAAIGSGPAAVTARPCSGSKWLVSGRLPFLDLDTAGLGRCLGPVRGTRRVGRELRRRYAGVTVLSRAGRVTGFDLMGSALDSRPSGARRGGTLAGWRRVLPGLRRSGAGRWTTTLRGAGGARVTVRVVRGRVVAATVRRVRR